jgi:hypothetical protein
MQSIARRSQMTKETATTAATVAEKSAHGETITTNRIRHNKDAHKDKKPATSVKAGTSKEKSRARKKPSELRRSVVASPRSSGKGAMILEMIGRVRGAKLAEIMHVTGWQAHSVRGFLSTAGKKHGIKIESTKTDGERTYSAKN